MTSHISSELTYLTELRDYTFALICSSDEPQLLEQVLESINERLKLLKDDSFDY